VLEGYDWPGNVRELRSAIARVAAMPDAPLELAPAAREEGERCGVLPLSEARREAMLEFEERYLEQVLRAGGESIAEAARLAGVSRSFLSRLAARHGQRLRDRRARED